MAHWPMDELDRAQRLVSLSEAPWTIGVAEFESEAEADKARLDWMETQGNPMNIQWSTNNLRWFDKVIGHHRTIREWIDAARNALNPTFTPIETDTKPK